MSTTDAETETEESAEIVDEARSALLEAIQSEFGDAVADTHLLPGRDLWIRVSSESWADAADYLRNRQRFRFFDWLSAIDWMPSPFGRSLDAEVDKELAVPDEGGTDGDETMTAAQAVAASAAGGESRFQIIARVHSLSTNLGVTFKADLDEHEPQVATWTNHYPGADWHEREASEMFGIHFVGHPGLRPLYLPSDFEGHPLRKDYPLLSRLVKPWPGIVDVEPMPSEEDASGSEGSS
ncbi:MAG: NADH-quinone oxidoreductase subunit C [Actinomycetota bacterium]